MAPSRAPFTSLFTPHSSCHALRPARRLPTLSSAPPPPNLLTCMQPLASSDSRTAIASPTPQQKLQQVESGSVVQLFRSPGLAESKARTLLRKAQGKASPSITGLDGELVGAAAAAVTTPQAPQSLS